MKNIYVVKGSEDGVILATTSMKRALDETETYIINSTDAGLKVAAMSIGGANVPYSRSKARAKMKEKLTTQVYNNENSIYVDIDVFYD